MSAMPRKRQLAVKMAPVAMGQERTSRALQRFGTIAVTESERP